MSSPLTPRETPRFTWRRATWCTAVVATAVTTVAASGLTSSNIAAAESSPFDSSTAIRYDDGRVIGDIPIELLEQDDAEVNVELPFPLNHFGETATAMCVASNGAIMLLSAIDDPCNVRPDKPLDGLAAQSGAGSLITPLGLDHDPDENLDNPQRIDTSEIDISQIVIDADNTIATVTTTTPHGFVVGDFTSIRGVPELDTVGLDRISDVASPTVFSAPYTLFYGTAPVSQTITNDFTERKIVYRDAVVTKIYEATLTIVGNTLEIDAGYIPPTGPDRLMVLSGTGIDGLTGVGLALLEPTTRTRAVLALPTGVTDIDPTLAGDQTTWSPPDFTLGLTESDGIGPIQQVMVGNTTVDGRDAIAITWYRMPTNSYSTNGWPDTKNPQTLTNTFQLVLVKRDGGSDTTGWDFDIEYNYGHARDDSDGYRGDDPLIGCGATEPTTDCRWAAGIGKRVLVAPVESYSRSGVVTTLNTTGPHGAEVGEIYYPLGLCIDEIYACDGFRVESVVDDDTLTFLTADPFDLVETTAPEGAGIATANAFALFPDNSVADLVDDAGVTGLVRNSLNSDVLGRYRFFMIDGDIAGFMKPTMGAGISYAPGFEPPPTTIPTTIPATIPATGPTTVPATNPVGLLPSTGAGRTTALPALVLAGIGIALLTASRRRTA